MQAVRPVVTSQRARALRITVANVSSAYQPQAGESVAVQNGAATSPPLTNFEQMMREVFNPTTPGRRSDWTEVEGNWVLRPPSLCEPEAVVHFLGDAWVGAAPQLAYRLFLEALASRNVLVIATPYATGFDHLRVSDEVHFKFDRCIKELGHDVSRLPVYGVGHALGALLHMLVSARFSGSRAGNALISFSNQPATDSIPFLSPIIAPGTRLLGSVLTQVASSPFRPTLESATETFRDISPSPLRQLMPMLEQLTPMYMDVAQGRQEFSPSPEEAKSMITNYYSVPRNLILRFRSDKMDESMELATMLQGSATISNRLDITMRSLQGDHVRPLHQAFVDLPSPVAKVANQAVAATGGILEQAAEMATRMGAVPASDLLEELSKGVTGAASAFGGQVGGPVTDDVQELADEVAAWMGVGHVVVMGNKALPAAMAVGQ